MQVPRQGCGAQGCSEAKVKVGLGPQQPLGTACLPRAAWVSLQQLASARLLCSPAAGSALAARSLRRAAGPRRCSCRASLQGSGWLAGLWIPGAECSSAHAVGAR